MFNNQKLCRYGQMVYNVNDKYVGRSFDLYGEFSQGECELFDALIKPGNLVLDVGANIGAHTLFFAKHGCHVLAFEPQRVVFQTLCANMAINSIATAYCYNMALGSQAGFISVPDLDPTQVNNFGGVSLAQLGEHVGHQVPMRTIDLMGLPSCALIKIDVEGMEEEVLKGAVDTLEKFKPALYVENDRKEKSESLIKFIADLGYVMTWHSPPLYNPDNFAGNSENVFGEIVSSNLICFHKDDPRALEL